MSSKPYILFYSNKCAYSNEVLALIASLSLNPMFLYVNIDNKSYTLPEFVDRVPLIFLKNSKELVVDQNVVLFINSLSSTKPPRTPQAPHAQMQEQALESGISDMSKGISSSYSFMNENEDKLTPMNYVFLNGGGAGAGGGVGGRGGDDPSRNMTQSEDKGKSRIDSASFEAYKQTRDQDDANFFPRKNV